MWMQLSLPAALSFPAVTWCPILSGWYILGFLVDLGWFGHIAASNFTYERKTEALVLIKYYSMITAHLMN